MIGPTTTTPLVRRVVLHGVPLLAVVVVLTSSLVLAGDLPDRVPSHWTGLGPSDDAMSLGMLTAMTASIVALLGLGLTALRHRAGPPGEQRLVGGLAVGAAVLVAGLHVATLVAARGTSGPVPFPGTGFAVAFVVAAGLGLLAARSVVPVEPG